jgi:predicted RNase H-like nuclease
MAEQGKQCFPAEGCVAIIRKVCKVDPRFSEPEDARKRLAEVKPELARPSRF